nr:hypothetical protein [Tanacetum cinerariifolium]
SKVLGFNIRLPKNSRLLPTGRLQPLLASPRCRRSLRCRHSWCVALWSVGDVAILGLWLQPTWLFDTSRYESVDPLSFNQVHIVAVIGHFLKLPFEPNGRHTSFVLCLQPWRVGRRSHISKTAADVGVKKDANAFLEGIKAAKESTYGAIADSACDNTGKR